MAPRTRFANAVAMFVLVGLGIGGVLVKTQWHVLVYIFFAWGFVSCYFLMRVKCPQCGVSVTYQGRFGGFPLFAGFANKRCRSCGRDLTVE